VDLVYEGILNYGVAVRSVGHTNLDLLIEGVVENSIHLKVPIDRPVDLFDKFRILLVTTFEHMVPNGICREEVGNFVCGEALGLCELHESVVAVLANPLPMEIVRIGCEAHSLRNIGSIGFSGRSVIEETVRNWFSSICFFYTCFIYGSFGGIYWVISRHVFGLFW